MSAPPPRENRTAAGVAVMFLAVTLFTCTDTSAKWLSLSGIPILQVIFARYAGHLAVSLALYLPQEGLQVFRSNAPWRQALRSVVLLAGTSLNFIALQYLPITITTTIFFAAPIVITLLAIPILGEKVGLRRIAAVCTGFLGVLVVIQPWGTVFQPAMWYSLGALLCASSYFIMTRMLAGVETNAVQQIWSSTLATIVVLPFVVQVWIWPDSVAGWFLICAIGAVGAFSHIAVTIAHRWADASILAPMIYSQIFTSSLAGILVFSTWPSVWTLAGGGIIIASGLYIWQRERARARV